MRVSLTRTRFAPWQWFLLGSSVGPHRGRHCAITIISMKARSETASWLLYAGVTAVACGVSLVMLSSHRRSQRKALREEDEREDEGLQQPIEGEVVRDADRIRVGLAFENRTAFKEEMRPLPEEFLDVPPFAYQVRI